MKDNLDKNILIENTTFDDTFKLYDITKKPFKLYGNCKNAQNIYSRMPESIAEKASLGVLKRAIRSAGIRLRFQTNSTRIGIKVKISHAVQMPVQTSNATKGFDIYVDGKYYSSVFPDYDSELCYEKIAKLNNSLNKDIVIYFPYNAVIEEVIIALDKTANVSEGNKYHFNTPIVFYGSSITHGCSSSRTGNTYTAILSRALDSDYINLGFGESCKGEAIMAEYIASLKKSVFVCGYDHNALTLEELKENHLPFYKRFRSIDKTTPILFVSSPNVILHGDTKTMYERMKVIEDTYKFALDSGDKKVYFINGRTLYPDDIRYDCSADGIHPNDLGAYMIAKGLYKELTKILNR